MSVVCAGSGVKLGEGWGAGRRSGRPDLAYGANRMLFIWPVDQPCTTHSHWPAGLDKKSFTTLVYKKGTTEVSSG